MKINRYLQKLQKQNLKELVVLKIYQNWQMI